MGLPVFILAGQSNAVAIKNDMIATLEQRFGEDGYHLVVTAASGAPLLFRRPGEDWFHPDELRNDIVDDIRSAFDDIPDAELAGLFWVQGEADTYPISPAEGYANAFQNLMDGTAQGLRDQLGTDLGFSDMPIVISELANSAPVAPGRPHWETIIAQQQDLADGSALIASVDPDDLMYDLGLPDGAGFRDALHYSPSFRQSLTEAMLDALPNDGTFPDTPTADNIFGTVADDTFFIDHLDDTIIEQRDGGHDTVHTVVDFVMRDHSQGLDDIVIDGAADVDVGGNGRGNHMMGNTGDNVMRGYWGNDTIDGGGGQDRLIGGHGNDVYIITDQDAQVVENHGQGYDRVDTFVDISLRDHSHHIEGLQLMGHDDLNATGNGRANWITGNDGDNVIDGAWGWDQINGGEGDDTLTGGHHRDWFVFEGDSGHDIITDFELGVDRLHLSGDLARHPSTQKAAEFLLNRGSVDEDDLRLDLGNGQSITLLDVIDHDGIGTSPEDYGDALFA